MTTTGAIKKIPAGEIAFFTARQKNKFFDAIFGRFVKVSENDEITKKTIAKRLGKHPSQITRWLSSPGNWELDSMCELLLALGVEIEPHLVEIGKGVTPNYAHDLNIERNDFRFFFGLPKTGTAPQKGSVTIIRENLPESHTSKTLEELVRN